MAIDIDLDLLARFEKGLDPRHPERSKIPARVLGYGEISTVFEIEGGGDLAYKRMPIFESDSELAGYERIFREYHRLLAEEIGLGLPPCGFASITTDAGRRVSFIAQKKLDPRSIGSSAIRSLPEAECARLIGKVLSELERVWTFNARNTGTEIGIDGQISNWSIRGFDPESGALPDELELTYFDTSTPFFRLDGAEQLDPELFLRSAPSFLVWMMRLLFLEDVMTRYYDFHLVAVDLIANFYKEQLPGLIPGLIGVANEFFSGEAGELGVAPITEKEVRSYYREDAVIWAFYLAARRIDRVLLTKIRRKEYPYILPGKIKR